ncbi:hypothetical protein WICPIJ_005496, partial [Wickerhamomyces pijperi]
PEFKYIVYPSIFLKLNPFKLEMSLIHSLISTPTDIRLLYLSVFLRLFAYSSSNIVLSLFLKALGIPESQIGIFMTLTLLGDTLLSYLLTWYADGIGRRKIMGLGCVLMILSGLIFANSSSFAILLLAAIFGVISPSGDEVGPFKSIEESTMAHLTPYGQRADVYALHWVLGTAGSAFGAVTTGYLVSYLNHRLQWSYVDSYRVVFYGYAFVGAMKLILVLSLSENSDKLLHEQDHQVASEQTSLLADGIDVEASDPYTDNTIAETEPTTPPSRTDTLSKETKTILYKLLSIFMLDSFGSGFMSGAWVVYYFKTIFLISTSALGVLFFITNICNSISALPSSYLAKALGPIKATLVVQVPSAIFLILTPLFSTFHAAAVMIIMFYSTSAMDVVPRQVLLTGLIPPTELTKVMGIVNIGKTFARTIGPIVTGILAEKNKLWVSFILSGGFIAGADLLLFTLFWGTDEELKKTHSSSFISLPIEVMLPILTESVSSLPEILKIPEVASLLHEAILLITDYEHGLDGEKFPEFSKTGIRRIHTWGLTQHVSSKGQPTAKKQKLDHQNAISKKACIFLLDLHTPKVTLPDLAEALSHKAHKFISLPSCHVCADTTDSSSEFRGYTINLSWAKNLISPGHNFHIEFDQMETPYAGGHFT